ncbi:MAG: hypothetical protein LAT77_04505 [Aliidiomarina sp.]|uniref:cytochrome c3 family protein n=1 Tax=Aliidiomarina sp. TaxID=1872439 RepID=UPI0025C1F8C4|nr:cytochrome c3 family protein [Aliidiomarina sp.]MCH8501161.1 hypothetical protein [Aliidiomarina sp.]
MFKARWLCLAIVVLTIIGISTQHSLSSRDDAQLATLQSHSEWVNEQTCQQCHQAEFDHWQGSHHHLAMLKPTARSVRGAFSDITYNSSSESFRFYQREQDYFVSVQNNANESNEFSIAYTFGWEPLQQYLVDNGDGSLQALPIGWDTEQKRWFELNLGLNIEPSNPLHWQRSAQNATLQCVECHTSGYQVQYTPATKTYQAQWQSLGVGCQACHGPAGGHLAWAEQPTSEPQKGFLTSLRAGGGKQVDTCAQCHSRRSPLGPQEPSTDFHDHYLLSLLTADLYEVDGKIKDEVFEYGSFIQSRMYQKGVVCSDCHNPHSGDLKAPGNGVCLQCHNPATNPPRDDFDSSGLLAVNYQSAQHHFHPEGTSGAQCSSCHMPSKVYMGNDARHDHSFSIPNPEQALALGHSDACLSCHVDDDPSVLVQAFKQRYPNFEPADGGFAEALFRARHGQPNAVDTLLLQLQRTDLPPIRYAALLAESQHYPAEPLVEKVTAALEHTSPIVRRTALDVSASFLGPLQLQALLQRMLNDSSRSVRMVASETAIENALQSGQNIAQDTLAEFKQVQTELQGRPEAHFSLAGFYQATQQLDFVTASIDQALSIEPGFSPAIVAKAQAYETQSIELSTHYLEEQVEMWPDDADLQFALSLSRIRAGSLPQGIEALQQAVALAPDNDYYAYVLAVAWYNVGYIELAQQLLRTQLTKNPQNRQLRITLMDFLDDEAEKQFLLQTLQLQNPYDPLILGRNHNNLP